MKAVRQIKDLLHPSISEGRLLAHFSQQEFVEKLDKFLCENACHVANESIDIVVSYQKMPRQRKLLWEGYNDIIQQHCASFIREEHCTISQIEAELKQNYAQNPELISKVSIAWNYSKFIEYCKAIVQDKRRLPVNNTSVASSGLEFKKMVQSNSTDSYFHQKSQIGPKPQLHDVFYKHLQSLGFSGYLHIFFKQIDLRSASLNMNSLWEQYCEAVDSFIDSFLQEVRTLHIKDLKSLVYSTLELHPETFKPVIASWEFSIFVDLAHERKEHERVAAQEKHMAPGLMARRSRDIFAALEYSHEVKSPTRNVRDSNWRMQLGHHLFDASFLSSLQTSINSSRRDVDISKFAHGDMRLLKLWGDYAALIDVHLHSFLDSHESLSLNECKGVVDSMVRGGQQQLLLILAGWDLNLFESILRNGTEVISALAHAMVHSTGSSGVGLLSPLLTQSLGYDGWPLSPAVGSIESQQQPSVPESPDREPSVPRFASFGDSRMQSLMPDSIRRLTEETQEIAGAFSLESRQTSGPAWGPVQSAAG